MTEPIEAYSITFVKKGIKELIERDGETKAFDDFLVSLGKTWKSRPWEREDSLQIDWSELVGKDNEKFKQRLLEILPAGREEGQVMPPWQDDLLEKYKEGWNECLAEIRKRAQLDELPKQK